MLFKHGDETRLEEKTEKILRKSEALIPQLMKASGLSFVDAIKDIDGDTGAIIGSGISLYKDAIELSLMQAEAMDKLLDDFEELKKMNDVLRKQNDEMQFLLRELSRKTVRLEV